MKGETLLIINPISGTRHDPSLGDRLSHALSAIGRPVTVCYTRYSGHAAEMAEAAAASGAVAVLVCGGDGTVNEVAGALIDSDTVLGILPNGSGNGLARHIGIPCDPLKAVSVIAADNPRSCDWCDVDGHPFFCAFGVGFDAVVAHRFATKGSRGLVTYLRCAIEEFRNYRPEHYVITTPHETIATDAMLISCCNASQFGNNAYIAPQASILDGLMDITIVTKGNLLHYSRLGIDLMGGALRDGRGVRIIRTAEAVIRRHAPGVVHIDGEPASLGEEVKLRVHGAGLRIYLNPARRPVRPWLTPLHLD